MSLAATLPSAEEHTYTARPSSHFQEFVQSPGVGHPAVKCLADAAALPRVVYAQEQYVLKSEDVVFVSHVEQAQGSCHSVYLICDGHQGMQAASYTAAQLPKALAGSLPSELPNFGIEKEVGAFCDEIRKAITSATVMCDTNWSNANEESGTTVLLAIVSGWLLTVANVGDSDAYLDTGNTVVQVTCSHRIQVNKGEQKRLHAAGAHLAPLAFHLQGPAKSHELGVGPLRLWPGGLCVSRSIGDPDVGSVVVPLPHVHHVMLPRGQGLRLIMASDGLWDVMGGPKAARTVRHLLPQEAASTLLQGVASDRRAADDVSIIILDMLPNSAPSFPASISSLCTPQRQQQPKARGLFSCFRPPSVSGAATGPQHTPTVNILAVVDCLEAYPDFASQALTTAAAVSTPDSSKSAKRADYTVHGGKQAHQFLQDKSWHTGNTQHGANNANPASNVSEKA